MAAVQIDNCFGVGLKIPAMSVALSTAFHNYGHVCGERDGVEGAKQRRSHTLVYCKEERQSHRPVPSPPEGQMGVVDDLCVRRRRRWPGIVFLLQP